MNPYRPLTAIVAMTLVLTALPAVSALPPISQAESACPSEDAPPNGIDAGFTIENGLYLSWGYQNGDAAYINPLCLQDILKDLLDGDFGLPSRPECALLEGLGIGTCDS